MKTFQKTFRLSFLPLLLISLLFISGCSSPAAAKHSSASATPSGTSSSPSGTSSSASSCNHSVWNEYNSIAHQCNACGAKEEHTWVEEDSKTYCSICFWIKENSSSATSDNVKEDSIAPELTETQMAVAAIADAKVGNYVKFGSYEQDNSTGNGKEDIEWLILAKEDGKAFLVSRYALTARPYDDQYPRYIYWDGSELRAWLNSTFITGAFTGEEEEYIEYTSIHFEQPGANDTIDRIFLLSVAEANRYFSDNASRCCAPTASALAEDCYTSDGFCWWWLRDIVNTDEIGDTAAADVRTGGSINDTDGFSRHSPNIGVRPAMWVWYE